MPYEPIPDDELAPEPERLITLPAREEAGTRALLAQLPDVAVFGLLLTHDPRHPLTQVVRERWSELHHLTGEQVLLVAFQPPDAWPVALVEDWRQHLGANFDKVWQDWQSGYGSEPGSAFEYLDFFAEPKLSPDQLPCLVLFTDPQATRAIVRSLPAWDTDSLFRLLMALIETMRACASQPAEARFDCLRAGIASPGAYLGTEATHLREQVATYVKTHPAQIVKTALSFILALATGGVVPLAPAALMVLGAVKTAFSR